MTSENANAENIPEKKALGCFGRLVRALLVFLVLVGAFLFWLNGPGMRWLGPKIGAYFLEKRGIEGDFELGGTLLGGVDIYDLDLRSEGALKRLVIDRLETDYSFSEILYGKLRAVSGEGVHVDLRLTEEEEDNKPPMDFAQLGRTLRQVREQIMPVDIDLKDVSFTASKAGETMVEVADSDLQHRSGSDVIELELGQITDASGRSIEPQKAAIEWGEEALSLDHLSLTPMLGISDLEFVIPESGLVSGTADIRLDEGVLGLRVGEGLEDVRLELREGSVDIERVREGLGVETPVEGSVTSLSLEVNDFYPEWQDAVGTVELFMEDFAYGDWSAPEAAIGVTIDEGEFQAKVTGVSQGSEFTVEGGGKFERDLLGTEDFKLGEISGTAQIGSFDGLLQQLDTRYDWNLDVTEFPESELAGDWRVRFDEGGFEGVDVDLEMNAKEADASPIRLKGSYEDNLVTIDDFGAEGMDFSGKYDIETKRYEGAENLQNFDSSKIEPWMKGLGLESPGSGVFTMQWEGSGDLAENTHTGKVTDFSGSWQWNEVAGEEPRAPISASGDLSYNLPEQADLSNFVVETEGQRVELDATMEGNALKLDQFEWSEGGTRLASGSGTLPLPEDFTNFREFLAGDDKPMDLNIETETIKLSKLRPWIPGLGQIDEKATGKVNLQLGGSLLNPEVNAKVEIKDISSPERPELPTSDLTVNINAKDGRAKISAEAVAPDYAPAVLNAEIPFRPREWAENPESLRSEPIKGRLDLPQLDVSRFSGILPGVKELGGVATGNIEFGGTIGKPVVDGNVKLTGGRLKLEGEGLPNLAGIDLDVEANMDTATIRGVVGDLEGGSLRINGTVDLQSPDGTGLGELNATVIGNALPIVRNDYLLLRADARLQVQGTLDMARVTGTVGVVDSVFYKDIELLPVGAPFLGPSAASLPEVNTQTDFTEAVPAAFEDWPLNVVVTTVNPVLIRGNLGRGAIDAAIRVEGTLGDPRPNGQARIRDAVVSLPFSTLEVREGYLNFTPETGFDPTLDVRATSEPRPYRVQIYAYGPVSNPKLVLTSQPPLPEEEIMTLLATGTTTEGLEDPQVASSRALQLLIEELRRGRFLFGDRLRPVLGLLDNVEFTLADSDPYDSDSYTSATVKLSERWYIAAGLGETGDQRVLVVWRCRFK